MSYPERWIQEFNSTDDAMYTRIHVIKKLSYPQTISWNAFFSEKHTRYQVKGFEHFFDRYSTSDYKSDLRMKNTILTLENSTDKPVFDWAQHDDLYAFYEYIGYDRNSKTIKPING